MSQRKRRSSSGNSIDVHTKTAVNPHATPPKLVPHSLGFPPSEFSPRKHNSSEQSTRYPNIAIEKATGRKSCKSGGNARYLESEGERRKRSDKAGKSEWTVEESKTLFELFKRFGSQWVIIAKHLPRHCENDVKNRFYTTLKRVATQAQLEDPVQYTSKFVKSKKNLIQFVDAAIKIGHMLPSKRGRKKNIEKLKAKTEGLLFPKRNPFVQPAPSTLPLQSDVKGHVQYVSDMCIVQPVLQYPLLIYSFSLSSPTSPQFAATPLPFSSLPSHQLPEYQQCQATFGTNGFAG